MAEIINLRLARKARSQREALVQANANRALHGRTNAEKARDKAQAEQLARALDQARRDTDD